MPQFHHLRKEVVNGTHCRIFDCRSYCKTFERIEEFWEIAKKDFPTLKKENCEIQQYGTPRHQRMIGFEFTAPSEVPADYEAVKEFDLVA